MGREVRLFDRSAAIFALIQIIISIFSIYLSEVQGSTLFFLRLSLYGSSYILCNLYFGAYSYVKKTNQNAENNEEYVLELYENPIMRACLRLHLRELMQEKK